MTMPPPPQPRRGPLGWLRNSFLAGVALVLPFVVTVWLIWTLVSFIDNNVAPLLPQQMRPYADAVPGVGVAFAVVALTLFGALAGNLFGRFLMRGVDNFIGNLPLVRSIYGGAKQVFGQIAKPEGTSFKRAVLVEYPKADSWAIAFVTNDDTSEVARDTGEAMVAVYVPTAPIPTNGFLLYLPPSALRPLSISPEEALKRVISLGIIRNEESDGAAGGPTSRS
jgi:uncharacterized membrane protein